MSLGSEGTEVYYNGVWLRNCITKQLDQSVEYDESGTDRLFTRFHITVESLVAESSLPQCLGTDFDSLSLDLSDAQTKMSALHGLLSVPRQEFIYKQGGVVLVAANALTAAGVQTSQSAPATGPLFLTTTDLNNGPQPKNVSIQHVIANRCYRITFSIELCLLLCGPLADVTLFANSRTNATTGPKVDPLLNRRLLSNRFAIEESRDGSFLNTRTLIGRARVAHKDLWDLSVRYLLLPLLPFGYKRENISFTHSANGLDVAYRVVDKQRIAAPPWPAIDFAGNHTEATGIDGVNSMGSISVRMVGQPGTAKRYLLLSAIAVVESKIGKLGKFGEVDKHVLVEHIQISDVLHENVVELSLQYKRHAETVEMPWGPEVPREERFANVMYQRLGLLPGVFALRSGGDQTIRQDGRPLNSDPWPDAPDAWGWEGVPPYGVFAQFWQDGCWPEHYSPDLTGYTAYEPTREYPRKEEEETPPPSFSMSDILGTDPPPPDEYENKASDEHKSLPYTHVEVKIDYFNDYGMVALPFIKYSSGDEPGDGDVLITRLHAPTCRKNIFLTAKRAGAQPKIPKVDYRYTDKNGITYVLDEFHPEFTAPRLMADGLNFEYQINARMVYLMSRAIKEDDELSMGSLPWDNTTKDENKVSINKDQQDEEMA
jgi:hypothetical protein